MTNQEAIKCLTCMAAEVEWEHPIDWQVAIELAIKALEEQKTGKWIYAKEQHEIVPMWECSCCRIRMPKKFNYCPNCDAEMEVEHE